MSDVGATIGFFVGVWATIGAIAYGFQQRQRWRWRRLMAAMNDGDVERAERIWRDMTARLTPGQRQQADVLYLEACLLALREDWQAGVAIADRLRDWKRGARSVMVMRARCLAELDRAEEAMTAVEELLALPELTPPLRAGALVSVAIVQLRRGEYARALATLEQAAALTDLKAVQASCSFYRGDALRAVGREKEAVEAYQRAAGLVPLSRRAAHARQRLTLAPPAGYR